MSFNIIVKFDNAAQLAAVEKTRQSLFAAEKAGEAMNAGFAKGAQEGARAAQQLATAVGGVSSKLGSGFLKAARSHADDLSDSWRRQDEIMERIHGPLREYESSLKALQTLQRDGALTAKQYGDELARLTTQYQKAAGAGNGLDAVSLPKAPAGGEHGGGHGGHEGAGGEIVGQMAALGIPTAVGVESLKQLAEISDGYTELKNSALKFVDSGHSVADILREQRAAAHDLHTDVKTTIELYDAVRGGTDGLNFSHREQIRLMKTLGEATQLANKPIDQTQALMQRLAYAFDSGKIEARELKTIMVQIPEVGDVWKKTFHTTDQGLQQMVASGKIGTRDLARAFIDPSKAIEKVDEDFSKRERTWKEGWGEVKDALGAPLDISAARDYWRQQSDFVGNAQKEVAALLKEHEEMNGRFHEMGDRLRANLDGVITSFSSMPALLKDIGVRAMAIGGKDAWAGEDKATQFSVGLGLVAPIGQAKQELAALSEAYKNHGVSAEAFRKKYEELVTTINNGKLPETLKLFHEIRDPVDEYRLAVRALDEMLARSTITQAEYNAELVKTIAAAPSAALGTNQSEARVERLLRRRGGFVPRLAEAPIESSPSQTADEAIQDEQIKRAADLYNASRSAAEKYADEGRELGELHKSVLSDDAYAKAMERLQDRYTSVRTPAEQLKHEIEDLNESYDAGFISLDAYNGKMRELEEKFGAHDVMHGFRDGLKQIKGDTDIAKQAQNLLVDGFNDLGDAIAKAAHGGKNAFDDFFRHMLADLAKLAAAQIGSAIGGPAGGLVGGLLGKVTGGLLGFAHGGDVTIPYAATGWNGTVGGMGGTDSKLFMAHVTPGEHVSIRTPEQMRAQEGGGVTQVEVKNINVADHRQAALQALSSREGEQVVLNVITKNIGAIRNYVTKQ